MNTENTVINFDYLSITFHVPKQKREIIVKALHDLSRKKNNSTSCSITCRYLRMREKSRYRKKFILVSHLKSTQIQTRNQKAKRVQFELSLDPIDKNRKIESSRKKQYFARLAFNPNSAQYIGINKIREFLIELFGAHCIRRAYETARITRTDICTDIFKPLEEGYPYIPKFKAYEKILSKEGRILSIILGSRKSRDRVTIYDKTKEQAAKGKAPIYDSHFRLELRRRDLPFTPPDFNANLLKDKLLKIEFFSAALTKDSKLKKEFRFQAENYGVGKALLLLPPKSRRKTLTYIRKHHLMASPFDINGIDMQQFNKVLDTLQP